ncbi:hypothetical protein GCM10011610_25020 [Nocardia rhizosphaerihabitans]|uniref:PIN domain-containing protein n=1 Tax=Nocardia rhizosphaerihabitans TaxID=1691570 RepID=A0ABQ2KDE2_9NOCA|nr:hypothetical protein GCM10011610_25020 [Nocardia rhizosphaerihabitans]
MTPAIHLLDTSGLFHIATEPYQKSWADQLTAGVIAICPIVDWSFSTRPDHWRTGWKGNGTYATFSAG